MARSLFLWSELKWTRTGRATQHMKWFSYFVKLEVISYPYINSTEC